MPLNAQALFAQYQRLPFRLKAQSAKVYPMYRQTLQNWAKFYSVGLIPTVEAFVALSPNNDYHGNLRSLSSVMEALTHSDGLNAFNVTTYRACAERALSYLKGDVSFSDTVTGLKIRAFRRNILYPDCSKSVTIDGHMVAVYTGLNLTMKEAVPYVATPNRYRHVEAKFRRAARLAEIPAPAFQAGLWLGRKAAQGINYSEQTDFFLGHPWLSAQEPQNWPAYWR